MAQSDTSARVPDPLWNPQTKKPAYAGFFVALNVSSDPPWTIWTSGCFDRPYFRGLLGTLPELLTLLFEFRRQLSAEFGEEALDLLDLTERFRPVDAGDGFELPLEKSRPSRSRSS
jgi:hypothetical protein